MTSELRGEEDHGRWGASLANLFEVLTLLLDAAGARSVTEVGAYAGDLTRELLTWASSVGARVVAVDPDPQPKLVELSEQREELELVRESSLVALRSLPATDAVIIDGDHNYYTVSEELRLLEERHFDRQAPLLLLHDVCWPHARRDVYFAPELVPEEHRRPMVA